MDFFYFQMVKDAAGKTRKQGGARVKGALEFE